MPAYASCVDAQSYQTTSLANYRTASQPYESLPSISPTQFQKKIKNFLE